MIALESVPMFKVFCFVFLGILLGYYLTLSPFIYLGLLVLFLFIAFYGLFKKNLPIRWITISSVCLLLCLSIVSAYNYSCQKSESPIEDGYYSYVAVVGKVLHQSKGYTRAYLNLLQIEGECLTQPYTIISNAYSDDLRPGDTLFAQSYIKQLSEPLNAGQFDVKRYYAYKWIYQTTSLSSTNFILLPAQKKFQLQRMFYSASKWSSDVFKKYVPHRTATTMRALLLGQKRDISNDMIQTYMHAGVMHVLAVSGLHVGILYLGFLLLLQPLYKRWHWVSFLPISAVWLFAFVTGGGPAVLRAALMITLIDIGKKLNEESNSV
ncbi:MAG TPA: ComEC family competence protein, partial [Chitinophagales bacterium]|nr:ComEC family competence protein [Chitinophagales bacterium]